MRLGKAQMKFLMYPSRCSSLRKQGLVLIILAVLVSPTLVIKAQSRPGYVYDYGYLLYQDEVEAIESLCIDIDNNTTAEVVVVILENLEEFDSIEMAKLEYFNDIPLDGITGIGKAGKDNGVLILIAVEEREWAFEIGYGVEGDLTDSESGRIGREIITPYFQDGEYYYGLFIAVATVGEELGYDIEGFESPEEDYPESDLIDYVLEDPYVLIWWLLGSGGDLAIIILVFILIAFFVFGFGGGRGGGFSGGGGGRGGWGGGGGRSGGGGSSGKW